MEELLGLGLPSDCKNGEVLEDRLLDREGNGEELRFVIFSLDADKWGIPYTKKPDGSAEFEANEKEDGSATEFVRATRYQYRRMLVPVESSKSRKSLTAQAKAISRSANRSLH